MRLVLATLDELLAANFGCCCGCCDCGAFLAAVVCGAARFLFVDALVVVVVVVGLFSIAAAGVITLAADKIGFGLLLEQLDFLLLPPALLLVTTTLVEATPIVVVVVVVGFFLLLLLLAIIFCDNDDDADWITTGLLSGC